MRVTKERLSENFFTSSQFIYHSTLYNKLIWIRVSRNHAKYFSFISPTRPHKFYYQAQQTPHAVGRLHYPRMRGYHPAPKSSVARPTRGPGWLNGCTLLSHKVKSAGSNSWKVNGFIHPGLPPLGNSDYGSYDGAEKTEAVKLSSRLYSCRWEACSPPV